MKKAGIAVAGVLLAGTLFACTACGEGGANTGIVNGNFTEEASSEQLNTAIEKIDTDNAFVDMTQETWKFGLQLSVDLEVKTTTTVTIGNDSAKSESTNKIGGKLDFSMDQDMSMLANGNFTSSTKVTGDGENASAQGKVNVYLDGSYVYVDATADGESEKMKISMADIMGSIGDMIPMSESEAEGEPVEDIGSFDISEVLAELADMGGKVYLDESDGLKIKISFGKELILGAMDEIPNFGEMSAMLKFDEACALDFYVVFDKDGKFGQFSFNTNITGSMDMSGFGSTEISVKGGAVLKASSANVTLPKGIETDSSYELKAL